ncbi:hypothetical protein B0H19DRAFT_1261100 [Mycena capillaripes]|nr:hypothetical protein B0H19DRAFT_1261100 [Mycena capillaripes]
MSLLLDPDTGTANNPLFVPESSPPLGSADNPWFVEASSPRPPRYRDAPAVIAAAAARDFALNRENNPALVEAIPHEPALRRRPNIIYGPSSTIRQRAAEDLEAIRAAEDACS